ncbi:MAG: hypothetical protein JNL58_29140 [Planctomyces sp.]|nr:hypothetical protein [Planctomyces sp.]
MTIIQRFALFNLSLLILAGGASAAPPSGGGGGNGGSGGGGGGGEDPPAFLVIPLANEVGSVNGMNDLENNSVELVGVVGSGNNRAPMYWQVTQGTTSATVTARVLPSLTPGAFVTPRDVSNDGIVVGSESIGIDPTSIPLVWASGLAGAPVRLPVPDLYEPNSSNFSDEDTWVRSISDDGIIVGMVRQANVADPLTYLIFWKVELVNGSVVVRDELVHAKNFAAGSDPVISRTGGHVAFNDRIYDGESVYDNAHRLQIGWDVQNSLLYVVPDSIAQLFASDANARDVNSFGTVAGSWDNGVGGTGGLTYGFAIDFSGQLMSIPTLPGFRLSGVKFNYRVHYTTGVNNSSEILTWQWASSSNGASLVRPKDALCVLGGTATDLSSFTTNWVHHSATYINNNGWIAGRTRNVSGVEVPTVIIR